jgi:hypothetical protein
MHTYASLSHPSSKGGAVTLRGRAERSKARAEELHRQALIYLSGGPATYKKGLNAVLGEVQRGLAAEARIRPDGARGLYAGVIAHLLELTADLPVLEELGEEEAS